MRSLIIKIKRDNKGTGLSLVSEINTVLIYKTWIFLNLTGIHTLDNIHMDFHLYLLAIHQPYNAPACIWYMLKRTRPVNNLLVPNIFDKYNYR